MSKYVLSYNKGKPIAYLKSNDSYKIIYVYDTKDEDKNIEVKNDKKECCKNCLHGGCLNCSNDCKDSNLKCCELCEE